MSLNIQSTEKILNNLANSLEIPENAQEKAENRYTSIGTWLGRDESLLAPYKPEFYSQGSIRLGTVIKPLNKDEEYDLDAVCLLNNTGVDASTQKSIKDLVGYELKKYMQANNFQKPINEGKRCWTLKYSDSAQFHMDVLPSVLDEDGFRNMLLENNVSYDSINQLHTATAIAITDNTSYNYHYINPNWNKSNPKGFHEWFKKKCKVLEKITKDSISLESASANVEEIPTQTVKLPLQKAIMILKRHRDIMFKENSEHKPISIIITTLSAKAYTGTASLKDTLDNIIYGIERQITCDTERNCIVLNPINPNENFADKWKNEAIKRENFFNWLEQLKIDYTYLIADDFYKNKLLLENRFGNNAIQSTYNDSFGMVTKVKDKAKQLLSLTHVQKPQWTMNLQYHVNISCGISKNGMLQRTLQSNVPVGKGWNLRFEANIENIGSGRKFYWQVANSGQEAQEANCLRGDFYDGLIAKGGKVREENTSYTGSHFVRCFIVQHNICVAISEPFIVNIT